MRKIKIKQITKLIKFLTVDDPFPPKANNALTSEILQAKENAATIIWAALSIERLLEEIIRIYLFDKNTNKMEFFNNNILQASFFTFAAKKQTALEIVKKNKLLIGKELSELQRYLKKIMDYRNVFAHGEFIGIHNDNTVHLKYYIGKHFEKTLDNNYWTDAEKTFKDTYSLLDNIRKTHNKAIQLT